MSRPTRWIVAAATTLLTAPLLVFSTASASARAAQCVYTPHFPSRVKVGQNVVGLTGRIRISGSGCASDFDANTQLVRGTDSYMFDWDSRNPDHESVYDWEVKPGRYRTAASDCYAFDNNFNERSCTVRSASTVIKFASRALLQATRHKSVLTFHAIAKQYYEFDGYKGTAQPVAIQRLVNGRWRRIHLATTSKKSGYTWTCRHRARARYRAITLETSRAFGDVSPAVRR